MLYTFRFMYNLSENDIHKQIVKSFFQLFSISMLEVPILKLKTSTNVRTKTRGNNYKTHNLVQSWNFRCPKTIIPPQNHSFKSCHLPHVIPTTPSLPLSSESSFPSPLSLSRNPPPHLSLSHSTINVCILRC